MAAALSAQDCQAGTSNDQTPPQMTTAASVGTTDPIYSTTPPIATTMQDGSASVFPKGWNPATGYGMHPDFFPTPPEMQFNASTFQPDPSALQPMGAQQDALATQPNAQGAWSPQQMAQANASAPPPMTPQQRLAILLQPQSPSEVLLSQSPHQKRINWVFHNQATGQIRYVNVSYIDITGQQSANPSATQPTMTQQIPNQMSQQERQMQSAGQPMNHVAQQLAMMTNAASTVCPRQMPKVEPQVESIG